MNFIFRYGNIYGIAATMFNLNKAYTNIHFFKHFRLFFRGKPFSGLAIKKSTVNQVFIPKAVYREVVIEGKRLGVNDAYRVENAVISSCLIVKDVTNRYESIITIHPGEIDVISLAKENKIGTVLIDDAKARAAAELAGLNTVGTLCLLLWSLKTRKIDFDGFLTILENIIRAGFYLKDDVYLKVIRMARKITS